jgi:hypothetical protein
MSYLDFGFSNFGVKEMVKSSPQFSQIQVDQMLEALSGNRLSSGIISSRSSRTAFNLNDNTLISVDPASGIFSLFFLGLISATITGGTLDGVTYSYYMLVIKVHYSFAGKYANSIPFYLFWSYNPQTNYAEEIFANLPVISTSGGASTVTTSHYARIDNLNINPPDEYVRFYWLITRTSGTVTIPSQTLRLYLALFYTNYIESVSYGTTEGGGGGVLSETINIYI